MKEIINQIFEIEDKAKRSAINDFNRNLKRIFHELDAMGFVIKNPIGEKFSEQRTDIETTILGELEKDLIITKTMKPIIYKKEEAELTLLQKGVVIVENKP